MHSRRQLIFRPQHRPDPQLPFAVRSAGHYVLENEWPGEKTTPKPFDQWFWTIRGRGAFRAGRKTHEAKAGSIFRYGAGCQHHIALLEAPWEYYWLTLHTVSQVPSQWKSGVLKSSPCPVVDFQDLLSAAADPTPVGERRCSASAYRILVAAHSGSLERHSTNPLATRCREWIDADAQDASFNLDTLVERTGLHRTTLFRAFQSAFGVAPSDYLQHLRVQRALRLLKTTVLPVSTVAEQAGFADANYFSRRIRHATGQSPREFRKSGAD